MITYQGAKPINTQSINELRDFHRFFDERVNNGPAALSPEEVVDEWRTLHPDPKASEEDIAALQEAIDDTQAGDAGIPFDEFDADFRARHGLLPKL